MSEYVSPVSLLDRYDEALVHLLEKAEQLKSRGAYDQALDTLHKVIIQEPECFEAYEEIGDNYISLRKLEKAHKALDHALKINPDSANALYLRGFLLSLERQWGDSIQALQKANGIFPNHPEILRCLGWSIYNESRNIRGVAILERSFCLSPKDPNILCDLGVCYLNAGEIEKAESTFEKVVTMDPDSDQAQECLMFLDIMHEKTLARKKEEA